MKLTDDIKSDADKIIKFDDMNTIPFVNHQGSILACLIRTHCNIQGWYSATKDNKKLFGYLINNSRGIGSERPFPLASRQNFNF